MTWDEIYEWYNSQIDHLMKTYGKVTQSTQYESAWNVLSAEMVSRCEQMDSLTEGTKDGDEV